MELIKKLREMSGAGMMDCKSALEEAEGDLEKAFTILREKGIAKASKRAHRTTGQGVLEAYLHKLAKELALQVGGYEPRWVTREDVPDEVLVHERNLYEAKAVADGKPE